MPTRDAVETAAARGPCLVPCDPALGYPRRRAQDGGSPACNADPAAGFHRPAQYRPARSRGAVAALRGRLRRAGCLFGSAKRPMTAQQSSVIEAQDTASGVFAQPKTAQKDAAE